MAKLSGKGVSTVQRVKRLITEVSQVAFYRPEGGEQEQDWMWFAPFGDAFSLLLVVRRFHGLRSFHQRLLKVGPLRDRRLLAKVELLIIVCKILPIPPVLGCMGSFFKKKGEDYG